jgi:spermidine/putrescine transport system substrate-binding protein
VRPRRRSLLKALGAAAVGFSLGPLGACAPRPAARGRFGEEPKLNFYNWDTYIGATTLQDFRAATGVDVHMSLFATNDELFAKLRAGNPGFDVIVPSDEFVARMVPAGMLAPLDHGRIPNFANVAPEFRDADYDPGRRYSMPYTWLVSGIGYRKSRVDGRPDSWRWLFDSDRYKGRIALFSEAADVIRLGAKYLGHSLTGVTPAVTRQVEAMLIRQKPNIRAFHDDNGQDLLLQKEVDLVLEYNGDIAQAMREDPDLDFVVPREGSLLNSDCLAIPSGAPRPNNAHAFINYLLDARAGAGIAETILYPTPNAAARALMPEAYKDDPVIFPPAAALARCEYGRWEGMAEQRMFEDAMTRIRAA